MSEPLLIVPVVLSVVSLALLLMLLRNMPRADDPALPSRLEALAKAQERGERAVREEMALTREELGRAARAQRQELADAFKSFGETVVQRMRDAASAQQAQLDAVSSAIGTLTDSSERKLEAVRVTVQERLQSLQIDNAMQLDQMRQTVDDRLHGTLESRLGESFRQVSERLEQVHKGLGEMQALAAGVGDLKKVLANVKTRGTWGEVQLGAMLEQVLTPDQFARNVATKDGGERVEFAVVLPGQSSRAEEVVWLPIDAKFPLEDYQRLVDAAESGDAEGVESAGRQLEQRVKCCAREIGEKYLNPPKTTDFGVLFLPIEALFAEVIRRPGLAEAVQRESRVVVAGPTTLWSILNSLQMGFRTLAVQQRSSEVWSLLAAVKTEWTKYGDVLDAVQKKLHQASDTIERAKLRSRAVGRKLKDVQALPAGESSAWLSPDAREEETEPGARDPEEPPLPDNEA